MELAQSEPDEEVRSTVSSEPATLELVQLLAYQQVEGLQACQAYTTVAVLCIWRRDEQGSQFFISAVVLSSEERDVHVDAVLALAALQTLGRSKLLPTQ